MARPMIPRLALRGWWRACGLGHRAPGPWDLGHARPRRVRVLGPTVALLASGAPRPTASVHSGHDAPPPRHNASELRSRRSAFSGHIRVSNSGAAGPANMTSCSVRRAANAPAAVQLTCTCTPMSRSALRCVSHRAAACHRALQFAAHRVRSECQQIISVHAVQSKARYQGPAVTAFA